MSHRISVLLVSVCAALLPAFPSGNSHLVTTRNSRSRNSRVFSHSNSVLPGIDILLRDSIGVVQGKRLGLITHQSGIDAAGVSTIDRLSHDPRVRLVSLFAPEHGMRSLAAPGELVTDTVDAATGLPIYSLYGASRAPTPARLEALDVLVVDLQDVGSRTWTYVSTMVLALRAGAVAHRRVVVLDRPNPIGCEVQGPILDTAYASFIGMLPIPLRHGMTMGELARFANARLGIGADLVVVPADGWRRCDWFDRTGLPWVRPSPNLPDLETAAWYPGTVLFEATALSVGRGTDAPFRQVGAPWLDARGVARAMWSRFQIAMDTVRFTPRSPGDGKFDGVELRGVRFRAFDRVHGDAVRDALRLLQIIRMLHPGRVGADSVGLARRLGVPVGTRVTWPDDVRRFRAQRAPFLLYR